MGSGQVLAFRVGDIHDTRYLRDSALPFRLTERDLRIEDRIEHRLTRYVERDGIRTPAAARPDLPSGRLQDDGRAMFPNRHAVYECVGHFRLPGGWRCRLACVPAMVPSLPRQKAMARRMRICGYPAPPSAASITGTGTRQSQASLDSGPDASCLQIDRNLTLCRKSARLVPSARALGAMFQPRPARR
jgi:hypothetical protein